MERIDIAEFNFDTVKLQKSLEETKTQMFLLKNQQDELKEATKEVTKQISNLVSENTKLRKSGQENGKQYEINREAIDKYRDSLDKNFFKSQELSNRQQILNNEYKQTNAILNSNIITESKMNALSSEAGVLAAANRIKIAELNKENTRSAKETLGLIGAYQKLNEELYKYRNEAKNVGAQMVILENSGKRLTPEYDKLAKEFDIASKKALALDNSIKTLDKSVGLNQRNVGNYSSSLANIGKQLVAGFGIIGGFQLLTSVISSSFNMVKSFDLAMADLAGVLETPKKDLTEMKNLFLELGSSTAFTATEVANASTELARLGFSQGQIKDSIKDVLNGTIAFKSELPEVAELSASVLNAFGLEASETGRVLNVLAASANKTAAGFSDFKTALPPVLAPAKQLGVTLERTTALLGILRDNSVDAGNAGTSLRNIFLLSDKQGLNYEQALSKIANSTNKVTTATKLFGLQNATQALILAENINKFDEYTQAVTGQSDALDFLVNQQMDTLEGSLKLLQSAWEGFILSIETGDGFLSDVFKKVIDDLTSLLTGLTDVSKSTKEIFNTIESLFASLGFEMDEVNAKEFLPNVFFGVDSSIKAIKGFLNILNELISSITDNLKTSEDFKQSFNALRGAANQLKKAFDPLIQAFTNTDDGVSALSVSGRILAKVIETIVGFYAFWISLGAKLVSSIGELIGKSDLLTGALRRLALSITSPTTAFKSLYETGKATLLNLLSLVLNTGPKIKQALIDALTLKAPDIQSITNDIKNAAKNIIDAGAKPFSDKEAQIKANNAQKAILKNDADYWLAQIDKEKAARDAKNNNPKTPNLTGTDDKAAKKAAAEAKKRAKEELDRVKGLADARINLMKVELDAYIQANNSKIKDSKRLTAEIVKEENNRLKLLAAENKTYNEAERQYKIDEVNRTVKNVEERNIRIQSINKEYQTKDLELNAETNSKIAENNKNFDDFQKNERLQNDAIDYQKRLNILETYLASEFDIKQEKLDYEYRTNKERQKAQDELEIIYNEELQLQKDEINGALDEATLERKSALQQQLLNIDYSYATSSLQLAQQKDQAKLKSYADIAGGISKIVGEETVLGKAAAIAEATINTYASAVSSYNSLSGIPVVGPALGIAAAGVAVASGLANVANIAGVDTGKASEGIKQAGNAAISLTTLNMPSLSGFRTGGYTGNGGINDVAGVVHGQEYVFTKEDIEMLGGVQAVEALRPTSPNYAGVNPVNTSLFQQSLTNNNNYTELAEVIKQGVYEGAAQGTYTGSQTGINDLNDNINIANGANF